MLQAGVVVALSIVLLLHQLNHHVYHVPLVSSALTVLVISVLLVVTLASMAARVPHSYQVIHVHV